MIFMFKHFQFNVCPTPLQKKNEKRKKTSATKKNIRSCILQQPKPTLMLFPSRIILEAGMSTT